MKERYRDMYILFWNERRSAFVCYSVFDMGDKYKVYSVHDGIKRFEIAFGTQGEAMSYAQKIF